MTTQIDDPHSPFDTGAIPMTLELPSELKASQRKEHEMKEIAMTLRLEPEVNKAIEAVLKLHGVESTKVFHYTSSDDLNNSPDGLPADEWDWVREFKPDRLSINSLITRFVLDALENYQHNIQKFRPKSARVKGGYEQILKFLLDHPEIEYARAEHFTPDDPAYGLLQSKRRDDGQTEWTVYDEPLDRIGAARGLAAEEALSKAASAALSAVELAMTPFHKKSSLADAVKAAKELEQQLAEDELAG